MDKIINFVGSVAALTGMITLRAYVVTVLWSWFAVAMFGVPQITVVGTIGVLLMINLIMGNRGIDKTQTEKSMAERCGESIGLSLAVLFVGFIIKLFM